MIMYNSNETTNETANETAKKLIETIQQKGLDKKINFLASLIEQHTKGRKLSTRQIEVANNIIAERALKENDAVLLEETEGFEKLTAKFSKALEKQGQLKGVKIITSIITLKSAKHSTVANPIIYVLGTEDKVYYGKIVNSLFVAVSNVNHARIAVITNELKEIQGDLSKAAVSYGKRFGICSCCGRVLTDPTSIEAGIGPVCAENWGF